jgi:hypothetical protein
MNKELLKKIKSYTLSAGAVLATSISTDAQIVYTDIDPDETFTEPGTKYFLDINDDAKVDFVIERQESIYGSQAIRMQAASGNEVLGATSIGNYFLPFALDFEANIDESESLWNGTFNEGSLTLAWGNNYGYFANGESNKYLGLRFQVDKAIHYAWLRLDTQAGALAFTVKEFAYESTANEGITAGEGGTLNINKNKKPSAQNILFPNPVDDILHINQTQKVIQVKLIDITGKLFYFKPNGNQINISNLNSGIYTAIIETDAGIYKQRIIIR